MTEDAQRTIRAARQQLETLQLFGVDFTPTGGGQERPQVTPGQSSSTTTAASPAAKAEALERLRQEHEAACPHCTTATAHNRIVFGEGNADAQVMFIGEAPGAEEDRTGRPFVGRAGQKLDDMIRAMELTREDVYIGNILKSRPPNNRTPQPDEVAGCAPYLAEQIRIIQPTVIVALGGPATKWLLDTKIGITNLRGQWGLYRDDELAIDVMPTFHPAYLLRNYTRDARQKVWSDLQAVIKRLRDEA